MLVNSPINTVSGDRIRGKSVANKLSFNGTNNLTTLARFQAQAKQPSENQKHIMTILSKCAFNAASLKIDILG